MKTFHQDSVSKQVVKVTSSATQGPDPYHFYILVKVVDYPFDLGQLIGSLMPNNWTSLTTRLENELREGAWKVQAPGLASKLLRVISMVDIIHLQQHRQHRRTQDFLANPN